MRGPHVPAPHVTTAGMPSTSYRPASKGYLFQFANTPSFPVESLYLKILDTISESGRFPRFRMLARYHERLR
jgi:hypothetical protein